MNPSRWAPLASKWATPRNSARPNGCPLSMDSPKEIGELHQHHQLGSTKAVIWISTSPNNAFRRKHPDGNSWECLRDDYEHVRFDPSNEPKLFFQLKSWAETSHGLRKQQQGVIMIPHGRFVLKVRRLIITPLQTYLALPFRIILGYIACFRTIPFGGFLKYGYPKSSKSLDHFSIETHGSPHFKKPPFVFRSSGPVFSMDLSRWR